MKNIFKFIDFHIFWYDGFCKKTYRLFFETIPRFIKYSWKFREELSNYYEFDSSSNLNLLKKGFVFLKKSIENGNEVESSRNNKVIKIERAIQIIDNVINDNYHEMAEKETGLKFSFSVKIKDNNMFYVDDDVKENNKILILKAIELEQKEWNELFEILRGSEEIKYGKPFDENYVHDGNDMRSWWN